MRAPTVTQPASRYFLPIRRILRLRRSSYPKTSLPAARLVRQLAPIRKKSAHADLAVLLDRAELVIVRAQTMRARQNRLLHSLWMMTPNSTVTTTLSPKADKIEEVYDTELRSLVDDAGAHCSEISDLWEQIAYQHGHFDELIRATERMMAEEDGESD